MKGFTFEDIPDQSGRTALVTGANTGIGFHIAQELARRGAHVLLGCRDRARAERARDAMIEAAPGAGIDIVELDLADLASVRAAAEGIASLDLLINNAGIMIPPLGHAMGGAERQFAVNHLGHFALSALLLDALARGSNARVVCQSSIAHRSAALDFGNLDASQGYSGTRFYGQSKLANLMFAFELDRRLRASGSEIAALACHPGLAQSEITRNVGPLSPVIGAVVGTLLNSARQGALPALQAATDPAARGGDYYGPYGFMELAGKRSGRAVASATARDPLLAARLWEVSKEMTGIDPGLPPAT